MASATQILKTPYKKLPLSSGMKRFFSVHKITNLEELMKMKSKDLLEMKWFNHRLYAELTKFLEANKLLSKLK